MGEEAAGRGGSISGSREEGDPLQPSLTTSHGQSQQPVSPGIFFPVTQSMGKGRKQAHEGFLPNSVSLSQDLPLL